jgi:cyclopropane-fatty-acyl-phospholipid synthase
MPNQEHERRSQLLGALFADYPDAPFAIRSADGWSWQSSPNRPPACTLVLHTQQALHSLLTHPDELTLSERFIDGEIDVEGDLFAVFDPVDHILAAPRAHGLPGFALACSAAAEHLLHARHGGIERDRRAIAYHYDLPVEFYRPWLGDNLVYSCAYFGDSATSLEEAQRAKLDLICRKLRLTPGDRFLDIGCGWGSLVLHAAEYYRVEARGITLSREQAATAAQRIAAAKLEGQCAAELLDYRRAPEMPVRFDKIASVGMFEHVGLRNLPRYFRVAFDLLKPGGAFLNHGIARTFTSPPRDNSFIEKYVFPNGQLVTFSDAISAAEAVGFEVRDVENLREHYERTLRFWVEGVRRNYTQLVACASEKTCRIWLLYMAGCAAAFRRGEIAVYQVLFSRPDRGRSGLPLTRDDVYLKRSVSGWRRQALPDRASDG